jgi:hypothetical protein
MRAQFVRGQDPKDAMDIGRVKERKIKNARIQIYEGIKKIVIEYWGKEVWELEDNPYISIKEEWDENSTKIGIEYTPEGPRGSLYYTYIEYSREFSDKFAAGYHIQRKFRGPQNPNAPDEEIDVISFDNCKDALAKVKYWIKIFNQNEFGKGKYQF